MTHNICSLQKFYTDLYKGNATPLQHLNYLSVYITYPYGGKSALIHAIENNFVQVFAELIQNVDALSEDESGLNVFHRVALQGNVLMMRILIAQSAQHVNCLSKNNKTPLYIAAYRQHSAMVSYLLSVGGDVTIRDYEGKSPLHVALDFEIYQDLLNAGAAVNSTDDLGNTPLHFVPHYTTDAKQCITLLLNRGANPLALNAAQKTPLEMAKEAGKPEHVQLMEGYQKPQGLPTSSDSMQYLINKVNMLETQLGQMHLLLQQLVAKEKSEKQPSSSTPTFFN